MAAQDPKILKDTAELVRLYNEDPPTRSRINALIRNPGATYKDRPLHLYVETIRRFSPHKYEQHIKNIRIDPSKIGELFTDFYRQGGLSDFKIRAHSESLYSPPEYEELAKIDEHDKNQDRYRGYADFLRRKEAETQATPFTPQQEITFQTKEEAKPMVAKPGQLEEQPAEQAAEEQAEIVQPATEEQPVILQPEAVSTEEVSVQGQETQGKAWVEPAMAAKEEPAKVLVGVGAASTTVAPTSQPGPSFPPSPLSLPQTPPVPIPPSPPTSQIEVVTASQTGEPLIPPSDESREPIRTPVPDVFRQAFEQIPVRPTFPSFHLPRTTVPPIAKGLASQAKIGARRALLRYVTPTRLVTVFTGALGGVLGYGATGTTGGALAGAAAGGAFPTFIKTGGGGLFLRGAGVTANIGSRGLAGGVGRIALTVGARSLFATPVGWAILAIIGFLVLIMILYFSPLDFSKSISLTPPYPMDTMIAPVGPPPPLPEPSGPPLPPGQQVPCPIPGGNVTCGSYWTPINGCSHCRPGMYPPKVLPEVCGKGWGTEFAIDIAGPDLAPVYLPTIQGRMINWTYQYQYIGEYKEAIQYYRGIDLVSGQQYWIQFHHTQVGSGNPQATKSGDRGGNICITKGDGITPCNEKHVHVQVGSSRGSWFDAALYLCQ